MCGCGLYFGGRGGGRESEGTWGRYMQDFFVVRVGSAVYGWKQ